MSSSLHQDFKHLKYNDLMLKRTIAIPKVIRYGIFSLIVPLWDFPFPKHNTQQALITLLEDNDPTNQFPV